jgi:Radical SAM proteins, N-terminal
VHANVVNYQHLTCAREDKTFYPWTGVCSLIYRSVRLSAGLPVHRPAGLPVHPSVFLTVHPSVCLSVHPFPGIPQALCAPATRPDLVGFSLSWELDYVNILTLLDQLGVPPDAQRRTMDHPLVRERPPVRLSVCPPAPRFPILHAK